MKQTSLLNLVSTPRPVATSQTPRGNPNAAGERFADALSSARPVRAPLLRQHSSAETVVDRQADKNASPGPDARSPVANRAESSSTASQARPASESRPESEVTEGEDVSAQTLEQDKADQQNTESTAAISSLADIHSALQALDSDQQQQFLREIEQLLGQLEQGDITVSAALGKLEQLLKDFSLVADSFNFTAQASAVEVGSGIDQLAAFVRGLLMPQQAEAVTSPPDSVPVASREAVLSPRQDRQTSAQARADLHRAPTLATDKSTEVAPVGLDAEKSAAQALTMEMTVGSAPLTPAKAEASALDLKPFTLTGIALESRTSAEPTALAPLAAQSNPVAAAPVPTERGFTVQTMVNTLVGQPTWGQEVGQKVTWLMRQNISEAQLRLDPPDLGPVNVKITVQNDQVQVAFTSHSAGVRDALDQSAQRLRELFAEQGLDLVNVDVSDQSQAKQQQAQSEAAGGFGPALDSGDTDEPQQVMEGRLSLIDHYA